MFKTKFKSHTQLAQNAIFADRHPGSFLRTLGARGEHTMTLKKERHLTRTGARIPQHTRLTSLMMVGPAVV